LACPRCASFIRTWGRRELEELSARFRSAHTTRERDIVKSLTWTVPGSVWAVDFSDAGVDIEGDFRHLLLVRDLATGNELLALPCRAQDARTVRAAFSALLEREGPPLVLKADNGGCFVADVVADLLATHAVLLLRSPPGTPQFNGACEAGGGAIKTRAHHIAAAHGRETCWSCDDVEAARIELNENARAWHSSAPTPGEAWRRREPLSPALRAALRAAVARRVAAELGGRGLGLCAIVDDKITQEVARAAIAGSLRALWLLSSRTTTIPALRGPRRTDKPEEVISST
jgi:hypothetical protein